MRKVSLLFMRFYPGLYSVKRYESIAAMTFDYRSDLERKTEISVTSRRLKFSKVGGKLSTPRNTNSYPLRDSIYSRD